jgi:hypothetical protein
MYVDTINLSNKAQQVILISMAHKSKPYEVGWINTILTKGQNWQGDKMVAYHKPKVGMTKLPKLFIAHKFYDEKPQRQWLLIQNGGCPLCLHFEHIIFRNLHWICCT